MCATKSSLFLQSASLLIAAFGLLAVCPDTAALAQDDVKHAQERLLLLERIRLDSDTILVVDDVQIVESDVVRLFNDCGFGTLKSMVAGFLPFPKESEGWAPGFAASGFFDGTHQYYHRSPNDLAKSIDADPNALRNKVFDRFLEQSGLQQTFNKHRIESNDFFFAKNYRRNRQRRLVPAYQWKITDELLWPSLDERAQAIILQSGISAVSRYEHSEFKLYFEKELDQIEGELTPAERDWFLAVNEVLQTTKRQTLGLKYHQKLLEAQARIQIGEGESLDNLVRPNSGGEPWRPDLGFEREQLVFASSIQMNALPSSAPVRAIPQIGLIFGSQHYNWLEGNMLGVLTELLGDSWNDLTAARIALYENDESEKNGWLSIIGVADSKDPKIVLRELERMSKLTSPEAAAAKGRERDAEIIRLIADLASGL